MNERAKVCGLQPRIPLELCSQFIAAFKDISLGFTPISLTAEGIVPVADASVSVPPISLHLRDMLRDLAKVLPALPHPLHDTQSTLH